MRISEILNATFGYQTFRPQQAEIIQHVLDGNDSLVIMPTGGGKSLCYQIPALASDGLTVVISPLIALMDDQVSALEQLNVKAGALHSNVDESKNREIIADIGNGSLKLLYVSPEKVLSNGFIGFLQRQNISLFAIDEAHCVSIWGNDFRPEYVKLAALKTEFPDAPTIALTATADSATQKDIATQLKLNNAKTFLSSFERANITTSALPGVKRFEQIVAFLRGKSDQAGIVYCLSRKSTEQLATKLNKYGFNAASYHAGMDGHDRQRIQRDFQNDEIQIVCATIAFGMGIDKPNIRWVVHYNMPKNVEGYYQEVGRAGRDGEPSNALLFYSWADYLNLRRFIDDSEANNAFKTVQRAKLERIWEFATALSCRTNLVLNYFGEYKSGKCDHCDNCLEPKEMVDGSRYAQMALSAMVRTNEEVGMNMLIDILRGSGRSELYNSGYNRIKTFGVGREIPFNHWRHYITQMINQGVVAIDFTDRSRLKTTPLSSQVLGGELSVMLGEYVAPEKKPKAAPKVEIDTSDVSPDLFNTLKQWRLNKAKAQKVPAYIILSDKALKQIAALKPSSKPELLSVNGIGEVKYEKYGDELLAVVSGHAEA